MDPVNQRQFRPQKHSELAHPSDTRQQCRVLMEENVARERVQEDGVSANKLGQFLLFEND
jgi:hypothetical protein